MRNLDNLEEFEENVNKFMNFGEVNYNKIIFFQINRCFHLGTSNMLELFANSVDMLEAGLAFYIDDEGYKKDLSDAESNRKNLHENMVKKNTNQYTGKPRNIDQKSTVKLFYVKKFNALIKLAKKNGLFGKERTEEFYE